MPAQFSRLTLVASLLLFPAVGLASTGSGNHGGDGVMITFLKAQNLAHEMVRAYEAQYLTDLSSTPAFRDWFGSNARALADDVAETPLVPTEASLLHDALTELTPRAAVKLSLPELRVAKPSREAAAALLIHESMHHLGVEDEMFAYFGASRITEAWERSRPRSPADLYVSYLPPFDALYQYISGVVMAGDIAFVWNGNSGLVYSPGTKMWRPVSEIGQPSARRDPAVVWTGTEVIVWGGSASVDSDSRGKLTDGYALDLAKNVWRPLSTTNAPTSKSRGANAVWTGTQMAIPGGCFRRHPGPSVYCDFEVTKLYDPKRDLWTDATALDHPRTFDSQIFWTGETGHRDTERRLVIVGSVEGDEFDGRISLYAPETDRWDSRTLPYAAGSRKWAPKAAWVGQTLIVFSNVREIGQSRSEVQKGIYSAFVDNGYVDNQRDSLLAPREMDFNMVATDTALWIQPKHMKAALVYEVMSPKWRYYDLSGIRFYSGRPALLWTGESILNFGIVDDQNYGAMIELPR